MAKKLSATRFTFCSRAALVEGCILCAIHNTEVRWVNFPGGRPRSHVFGVRITTAWAGRDRSVSLPLEINRFSAHAFDSLTSNPENIPGISLVPQVIKRSG